MPQNSVLTGAAASRALLPTASGRHHALLRGHDRSLHLSSALGELACGQRITTSARGVAAAATMEGANRAPQAHDITIKVVGLGGGGGNAVNRMVERGVQVCFKAPGPGQCPAATASRTCPSSPSSQAAHALCMYLCLCRVQYAHFTALFALHRRCKTHLAGRRAVDGQHRCSSAVHLEVRQQAGHWHAAHRRTWCALSLMDMPATWLVKHAAAQICCVLHAAAMMSASDHPLCCRRAGAGGNPQQGQLASEESETELKSIIEGANMVRSPVSTAARAQRERVKSLSMQPRFRLEPCLSPLTCNAPNSCDSLTKPQAGQTTASTNMCGVCRAALPDRRHGRRHRHGLRAGARASRAPYGRAHCRGRDTAVHIRGTPARAAGARHALDGIADLSCAGMLCRCSRASRAAWACSLSCRSAAVHVRGVRALRMPARAPDFASAQH
jgi:hypothetical protein